MQAEGWLMLEAAAHCDVLLPPEFVIELHSAGLMQSSCPAPAAPPRYCWVRFIWFIFCNLWFRIWHVCTTADFWPPHPQPPTQMHSGTSEHLEEFLQIDTSTINTVFQRPFIIARRRNFICPCSAYCHCAIAYSTQSYWCKIEEHCKLSISTAGHWNIAGCSCCSCSCG